MNTKLLTLNGLTPSDTKTDSVADRLTEVEEALSVADDTAIELYEANAEQSEINEIQDESLIEIYELLGELL